MDNGKRFSILKPNKFRNSIVNDEEDEESPAPTPGKQPRISMRRVSFASSNFIKEFAADSEKLTIWNTTYEETIDKSDSTQSLQNTLCMQAENLALGNSNASINLERATEQTINFQALGGEDILLDTTLINIDCDDDDDDSKDNCNKENEPPKYKVSDMDFTQFVPFKEKTIVTDAENKTQFVSENLQLTCQQPILLPIATRRNKTIFGDNMELVVSSASTPDLSLGTSSSDKSMELTLPIGAEIKTIPDCDTKMELTTFSPNAFKSELQAGTSQNASIKEKSFCNNEKIQDKSINPVVPMASQNSFRASKDALLPPKETTLNPNLTSDKHDTSIITHNKSKSLSFQQCETKNNTLDTDINVCKLPKIKIKAQSRQTSKTTNNMSVFVPDISITNFKKCASSTIIMGSVASNVSLKISEYSKLEMSDTNACKKIAQSDEMGVLKHMSANNSSVNISRKRASTTTLDRESKLASFESRSKIPTPVKDSSPSSKCFNNSQKLQSSLSASALQQSFLKQTSCSSKILFTPQPSTVTNLSCNGSRAGLGSDRAPNMTLDNLFVLQKTADTAGFVSNVSGCKETNVHAFSVQESCTVTGNDAPNESAKGLIEQKSLSTNIVNNYTLDVKSIREESAVNVSESLIGKVQVSQNLEIEDSVVRHANSIITGIWTKGGITNRSVDVSENVNIPGDSQHHELLLSQVVLNTSNIDSTCDGVKACASTLLNEHQKTNTKPDVDISIPDVSTCQISVNVNIDQTSKSTIFVPDTNLQHETSEPSHETNLKYTKDNQSCLCNDSANMSFVNKSGLLRSFAHTSSTRQTGEAILPTTNMVAETIKGVTSSYCGDSPKATCTNVCLSSSTSTCQTDEVILPTLNMLDETVMGATNSYRVDSPKATCDINVCLSSNMSAQKSLLSNTVGADITLERSLPQIDNIIDSTSSIIEIHSTENNCTPPLETNLSVKAEIAHTNVDVNSFIYVGKQTQASDIKSKGDFLENFHVPIQVLNGTLNAMILSPTNDIQEIPTNDSLLSQSIITICDESVADDVNLIDAPLQGTTLNDNQEVSIIDTNLNMQGAPIDNDPICVVASLNEDIITSDANVEQQIFADSNSDAEIIKPTIADVTQFINADISKRKDASLVTEHNLETTQNHCKVVVKKEISTVDEKNVTINEANDISKQFAPQNANQQESMLRLELSNIIRPKNINNVSDVNDKVIDTSFDKSLYPGLKNLELNKDSSFAQFLPFSSTAISKTTLNIDVSAAEAHSNLDTTGKPNNSFTLVTDVETQAQPQTTFVQESTKTQTLLPFTEKTTNTDISVADAQLITDKTTDKVIQNWSSNRNTTLQNSNIIHDGNFKNDIRASQIVPNVSSNVSKQAIVPLTDRILSSVLGETLINVDKSNNENVQNKTGDFLQLVCGPTTPDESVKHDDLVQPESLKIVQGIGEQSILPPLERILSVDKTNNDYTQSKVSNESVELVSCSLSQKLNVTPAVKFENSIKADSTLPQFVTGKQIITPLVDRIQNDSVSATTHNDDGPKNINVQSNTCNNSQSLVSCPANATSHNSNIEDDIIENVIETKSVFQQLVSSKQTISSFSENSLNIDHTKTETVRRRSSIALLQFVLSSTTNLRDPTLQNSNINEDVKLENDQTDESISHTMKQTILSPPKTTLNVDVSLETQLNLDVTNKPSDASKESLQVAPCSSISISKTTLENSNASVLPENVLQESRQFDEKSISVNVSAVEILNCGSSIVLRNHEDVAVNPDNKIKINNTCNTNIPCNLSNDCQETLAPSLTQVAFKSIVHLDESSNIIKQAEKNLERDVTIFDNELNLPNESIDGVGQETTTGTEPYTNVNQNEAQFLKTETLETNNLTNYITENVSVSNTSQIKANDCMEPNDRASQTLTPSPNIGNYDGNTSKQNMSVLADINLTAMKENSSSAEGDYNAIKVSTPLKTNVSQNDDDNWTDISVTEEQEDYQKDNKNVNAIEFMDCDEVKTPTASSVNITLRNKTKPEFYRNIQTDMDTDDDFEMSNDDVTIDSFFKSPRYQTQGVSQVLNNTHVPVPENTFQSFSEKNVNELQALTINTPRTASNTTQIKLVVPDNSNLEPDSKSNGISPTRITMHDVDEYFREMEDKHLSVPDFNVSKTCEPEPVVFASESLCSTNVNALEILSKTTARELKTDTVTKPENNMKIFADTNFTTPINIYKTKTSDLELTTKPVCDFSIDVSPGKIATPNIVQPSPANVFKLSLCTTLTDSKTNIDSISEKTDKFAVKTRENDVLNESLFKRNTSPNQLGNKTAEDNDCEAEKVDRSIKTSISDGKLCDNSVLKNLSIKNWTYTKQTAKDNKQEDTMDIDLFNLPNVPACNDLSLWKHNSNANMSHYPNISMASFNAPSHFGNETEASTTMDKVLKTTYTIGKKSDAKNQRLDFKTPKRSVTPFHQNIISFSPCIDDTQHLINLNLENRKFSDNSKSDFSKIIAGETPLCMSRRFMPLGDFNNSAFPTSLENTREETNIDDEQLKYDIKQLTNSYKDDKTNNISEESLELHTTINDTFTPIATATQNTIPAGTRGIGYISESSVDELLIESMSDKFEHFEEEMKIKFSRIAVACAKFKNQQNEILKNIRKKNLMRTAVFAEIQINDTPDSCDFSLDCTMDNVEKELVRFEVPSGIELERIVTMKEKIEEKLKSSKGYWNIISIHANELKLATLFNTIHLSVCFNTETGVVNTIEKSYKISEKSHTQAIYVHELLKSRLSTASIQSAIGERFDVLSLIDFICINMRKMLDILKEFDKLEDKFGFKIAQSLKIATFKVFSLVRVSAWTICLDITDLNNMTGDAVSASAECGVVNESDIKNLVKNCRKGLLFFNDFTYKVHLHSKLAYNK